MNTAQVFWESINRPRQNYARELLTVIQHKQHVF